MDIFKDRDLRLPLMIGLFFLLIGLYLASKVMSLITGSTWSGFLLFISVSVNVVLLAGIMTPAQFKSFFKTALSSFKKKPESEAPSV